MAIEFGPIVMPCRFCDVAPGQPCDRRSKGPGYVDRLPTERAHRTEFHTIRIGDAKLASELVAD